MNDPLKVFSEINEKSDQLERRADKLLKNFSRGNGPFKDIVPGEDALEIVENKYDASIRQIKEIEKEKNELYKKYSWYKSDYEKKIRGGKFGQNLVPELEEKFSRLDRKIDRLYSILESKYNSTIIRVLK